MNSSPPPRNRLVPAVLMAAGIAYPFAILALSGRLSPVFFTALALALAVTRLAVSRRSAAARALLPALTLPVLVLVCSALVDPALAALLYPVAMNLGMALAFALSLRWPPTLIEALASLTTPAPSAAARAYMRRLSLVWCLFLTANAAMSALTVWWGELWLWTVYNGFVSYVLIAALVGGEWLVRRCVRHAAEPAS